MFGGGCAQERFCFRGQQAGLDVHQLGCQTGWIVLVLAPHDLLLEFSQYIRYLKPKTLHEPSKQVKAILRSKPDNWLRTGLLIVVLNDGSNILYLHRLLNLSIGTFVHNELALLLRPYYELALPVPSDIGDQEIRVLGESGLAKALNEW